MVRGCPAWRLLRVHPNHRTPSERNPGADTCGKGTTDWSYYHDERREGWSLVAGGGRSGMEVSRPLSNKRTLWWLVSAAFFVAWPISESTSRHPVLIDAAIQSGGVGFVGTDRSTMSIIAMRRVQSWQNGITALVKWGHIGADDH